MVYKKLLLFFALTGMSLSNAEYRGYSVGKSSYYVSVSKEPSCAEKVASFFIIACVCAAYGYLAIKYPEAFEPRYVRRTVYVPQTVYVPTTEYVRYW